ncbi:hypothetical protein ACJJTC_013795 [Scirpophaga incertulas]
MPRGKTLRRQSRKMLYDVYKFMAKEAEEGVGNLKAVQKRTATATQTSLITVKRIVKEANSSELLSVFRTPGKKRPRSNPVTDVDDFDKGVIKRCIHNFHITNKALPTIKMIKNKLRDDIGYQGSATSLRKIIKNLGFRWRKTENNRKILIEKSDLRLKRIQYLKKLGQYRQEGCPIIYTDESYVHSTHTTSKGWSDLSLEGLKKPMSKGQRVVIVHAAIKRHVSSKNGEWTISGVMELVKEKVDQMGPNEWKALCEKTRKIEQEYIESDHIIDDLTDQEILISLGDSSDEGDSDTEDSENSSAEDGPVTPQPSTSGTARDSGCHRTHEYITGVRFIDDDDSDTELNIQ